MNRRGFFGRLLGAVVALVGVKAVEAKPIASVGSTERLPWIKEWTETDVYRQKSVLRRQGRLYYDETDVFALQSRPILYPPPGWMTKSSSYTVTPGDQCIDFDLWMEPIFFAELDLLIQSKSITKNEARKLFGLPPVLGWDSELAGA